jgi:protoheme IX farnesyltransferase
VLYLGLYTPLKTRTTLATAVGAFPGALPPLIGWAAARGSLSAGAWVLFGILFLWQFPHFMAIAWMYREDYARAGIKMLPVVDPSGDATFAQIIGTSAMLVPMSLLPAVMGMAGIHYFFGALVLGMILLQVSLWANRHRANVRAKWLMHATVAHIPILLAWMIFDKVSR